MIPETATARREAALPDRENAMSRRYLRVLEKWMPVGRFYFNDWPERPNCGHFLGGCHWYGIETIAGAITFAAAASSSEFDESRAGCSREDARRIALKGLRYLCFTHDTGPEDCVRPKQGLGRPENFGRKWGERGKGFFPESQCGTTVAEMAVAALLLGELVDDETWTMLAAIHEDYANRFGDMPPRSGVYVDTQMEENGWTSCGLASVALFLDRHSKAAAWAKAARHWMFHTASTPQDGKDYGLYGEEKDVARLIGKTFTTLPDYMAENHGIVHPSYTACSLMFTGFQAFLHGVFGAPLPQEALFNRKKIYDRLKRISDRRGYLHPVQGMDWPYLYPDPLTSTHATAAVILKDPDGARVERRALETLEAHQNTHAGRMYDRETAEKCHDIQDPMIVRECLIGAVARSYLIHRLYGAGPAPTPEKEFEAKLRGVTLYPHSGFVFQRHGKGQTSFSWRNCIMALPLNSDGICTVAPASNSFLGTVKVKDRPDCQRLVSIHVDQQADGLAAALVMDRAQGSVRQQVLFAGLPDGTALSWERFTALEDVTIEAVTQGFLRIINEKYPALKGNCKGARTLYTPQGSETFRGFVSEDPASDIVRTFQGLPWVNVDDRIGIVFRPTGKTVYHNRHYFRPWWAVADDLILSRMDAEFTVPAGQPVAELVALVAPDQTHEKTARQTLAILAGGPRGLGLVAGKYLAAASISDRRAEVVFRAVRSDLAPVPVFPGRVSLTPTVVLYAVALEAGAATLRRAITAVEADGCLDIVASETGDVFVRNSGRNPVRLRTHEGNRSIRVMPNCALSL